VVEKIQERVKDILSDFTGLNRARDLFAELNYDLARDSLPRRKWNNRMAAEALVEDPQVIATHNDFRIIYNRLASDKLGITQQRAVVNRLLCEHPYALFLFSTEDQKHWHFVNVKLASEEEDDERNKQHKKRRLFRRFTIREHESRLRTAIERLSKLNLESLQAEHENNIPPLEIQSRHDEAFNVQDVTEEFYKKYEERFNTIMLELKSRDGNGQWAHDYALQLLNRTMFLYFVQRKGWLGKDSEFFEKFWNAYEKANQKKDTFFPKWLTLLFFEVFNKPAHQRQIVRRAYLPDAIRSDLSGAPYLNGGLFKENKLDRFQSKVGVTDHQFSRIFDLFQSYNFTITENSPLDQEVAVDPEMIGKVYETLVNVSEAPAEQKAAGIVYTPRTEIDLMCRLSLVDNLANHLGAEHKNLFYRAIFSLDQEDREQVDKDLADSGLWPDVEKRLNEITVLDSACGSGSFLVGMLYILNDVLERAERQRGVETSSFERKKRIIGQSLYGVEVMDWACHVAELRLWLSLIVDAQFGKNEPVFNGEPLLPNFRFNIRCGDSLVQEVGGLDMAHRRGVIELSPKIKPKLNELKREKKKFYNNEQDRKFKSASALESHEVRIFRELLQDRIDTCNKKAKFLMQEQAKDKGGQQRSLITGELEGPAKQLTLAHQRRETEIVAIKAEAESMELVHDTVRDSSSVPFVWDIAFAEIFSGDKHGFDIVIGNPPYVRQEKIANPQLAQEEVTTKNKKEYKAKLIRSVYEEYPRFFGYKAATDAAAHRIAARSDLCIYFYFHGLSLLNDKGSFCFITSNSWLDVDYGKDLQEFLLRRCHLKLILDNKVRRVFKDADVNTVIVLFGPPEDLKVVDDFSLDKTAKFVMFYVPFEEVLHPVVFEEIEEFTEKTTKPEYRVFPIKQANLLTDRCEPSKSTEKKPRGPLIKTAKYIANRWGGQYLRAPDIYWTVLEKGKDKLVRLGDIAEVRFGIKTGANEFFYLDDEKIREWGIEKEFLQPVLKSAKDSEKLLLCADQMKTQLFICHKGRTELKTTRALNYIQHGEQLSFNKTRSVSGRKNWYDVGAKEPADAIILRRIGERCPIFEANGVVEDCCLFGITRCNKAIALHPFMATLNSTWTRLHIEINTRQLTGAQAVSDTNVYVVKDAKILNVSLLSNELLAALSEMYLVLRERPSISIFKEVSMEDRQILDSIVFDQFSLTKGEREAVYEAVIDLVESRLKKADSLRG